MNEKTLKVGIHVISWIVFFMLPFGLFPKMNIRIDMLAISMLPNLLLVAYFYANLHFFVPRFLLKRENVLFLLVTIFAAAIYILLTPHPYFKPLIPPELKLEHLNRDRPHHPKFFIPFISILLFLLVFILSTGVKILEELFNTRQKEQAAGTAKSNAELATLKAQINPHFLFNTLNGIYSLSIENSPKTSDAIMRLSGLMRYILTESESEYVPLSIEIDYLKQYVALQELRLTKKTKVSFTVEGDIESLKIAPLLLEPFVENAFKYGVSLLEDSEISIAIKIVNSEIQFSVRNRLFNPSVGTSKLGTNNVKQRLQIIYPSKHVLTINNLDSFYEVLLKINAE